MHKRPTGHIAHLGKAMIIWLIDWLEDWLIDRLIDWKAF